MLDAVGIADMDALVQETIPESIRLDQPLDLPPPLSEVKVIEHLRTLADQNQVVRSLIGLGYHDCVTPPCHSTQCLGKPRLVHSVPHLSS